MKPRYVVATIKPWNIAAFNSHCAELAGQWVLITSKEDLTLNRLREIQPKYIFFPHWSWPVPTKILQEFPCVCFHETDLPYGRGGSPLQNLIIRGHKETKMTALRMVEELDAGPVYLKRPLSLAGRAEEIFERAADLVYDMIGEIITREIAPLPQQGEAVVFNRRTPNESVLPQDGSPSTLFDFIRMLDAPTYPKAFIDHGQWRIEFDRARAEHELSGSPRGHSQERSDMSETVLAVVAHPDDEVLGTGGTLARHAAKGDAVHILFLADGVGARGDDKAAAERRAKAARLAASALGAREPEFLGLPDNRLDRLALLDIVQPIENAIRKIAPQTIYTHHAGDLNIDHGLCHRAVLTACRPLPDSTVLRIYAMEVPSSTEWSSPQSGNAFMPTHFVDISGHPAGEAARARCLW